MQKPQRDIPKVLSALTTRNPADLQDTVTRFYTHDASLRHPLSIVSMEQTQRRRLSPDATSNVNSASYDIKSKVLIADVTRHSGVRFSPFKVAPSRHMIRLELQEHDGLYYILSEEDLVHSTDLMNSLLPPLAPLVQLVLIFFAFMAVAGSKVWFSSLLLSEKLFGMGSDTQRGKTKPGSKKFTQAEDQETEGKSMQNGSSGGKAKK
ncbi:uncharacterized protein EDB91DRAFT_1183852 [Suillus paluster]|uniref:uncharacterized protein n=1 Tax=Suillus paluster TaxID=48578 RepID=UPI001B86B667|nr:uncharacterized protein EDB91DRAFT_1183852 [Suillus paluster]KAG1718785.1 hypothetical protein EDB91DRAFT_1183852 [Suillus paluster]